MAARVATGAARRGPGPEGLLIVLGVLVLSGAALTPLLLTAFRRAVARLLEGRPPEVALTADCANLPPPEIRVPAGRSVRVTFTNADPAPPHESRSAPSGITDGVGGAVRTDLLCDDSRTPAVILTPPPGWAGRRLAFFVLGPLVLFLVGLGVLLWTLPLAGVRVPGMSRVTRLIDSIQFPWEPPRPVHVPLPEPSGAAAALPSAPAVPAPTVDVQPAPGPAVPVAQPAAPAVSTAHPALAQPLPASFTLPGQIRHQWQTWNNCGPATITMATSYFGRPETQAQAATVLKPNPNDKNVGVDEMAAYARSLGLRADNLYLGDLTKLKRLVTNGVPVVISMWYTPHPNDGLGHYRLLTGYDDAAQQLIFHDSFQAPGVNLRIGYAAFDNDWRVYQRAYMPVYSPEKADVVAAIVGQDMDEAQLRQRAVAVAQEELSGKQNDAFAWFNVGTALTRVGRTTEAVQAFDRARALLLPWRMLWYQFVQFEAYLAENRPNDVLALTQANLAQAPDLEESHYFRGKALEGQGNKAAARTAYRAALRSNPNFAPAAHALSTLTGASAQS